jgi:RNA polymerase sigma-70 factor, ECF subfamily
VPDGGTAGPGRQGLHAVDDDAAELLAALAAGDRAAFTRVAKAHYDLVYRIAWRMLGGPGEAEDVAQDVFLRLWHSAGQVRQAGSLRAWLARVATNLAIDRLRRRRPEVVAELPEIADPDPGPDRRVERRAAGEIVSAAVAGLPERQRVAVVLTYYEELANAEVAEALGISVEAVESLLARARRKLKEVLDSDRQQILASLD